MTLFPFRIGSMIELKTELARDVLAPLVGEVLKPYPVALAYLFGSAARGQTTPFSDVDIAVVLAESASSKEARGSCLHLELEIEEKLTAHGLRRAEVHVINDAPLELRGQVVTEGRLLYARDLQTRIEFETRIRMEYFDFLPTAEFHRRAFFAHLSERGLLGQR